MTNSVTLHSKTLPWDKKVPIGCSTTHSSMFVLASQHLYCNWNNMYASQFFYRAVIKPWSSHWAHQACSAVTGATGCGPFLTALFYTYIISDITEKSNMRWFTFQCSWIEQPFKKQTTVNCLLATTLLSDHSPLATTWQTLTHKQQLLAFLRNHNHFPTQNFDNFFYFVFLVVTTHCIVMESLLYSDVTYAQLFIATTDILHNLKNLLRFMINMHWHIITLRS